MAHRGIHVRTERISNGAVVFHAHCEDDPEKQVARHTCYVEKAHGEMKSDSEIEQEIQEHLKRVEQLHDARVRAEQVAQKYMVS